MMSREIKFRHYHKCVECGYINIMLVVLEKDRFVNKKWLRVGCSCNKEGFYNGYEFIGSLQYTGPEDKNGREIYEGDIVKRGTYGKENKPIIYLIKWQNGGFITKLLKPSNIMTTQFEASESEIIGNIYENPELLGGGNERSRTS